MPVRITLNKMLTRIKQENMLLANKLLVNTASAREFLSPLDRNGACHAGQLLKLRRLSSELLGLWKHSNENNLSAAIE